jgi:hypothetical protein
MLRALSARLLVDALRALVRPLGRDTLSRYARYDPVEAIHARYHRPREIQIELILVGELLDRTALLCIGIGQIIENDGRRLFLIRLLCLFLLYRCMLRCML